jgi:flagellar hook-associated protein 3 FlgL
MEYNGDTKDVARQIASNVTVAIPSNGGDITETTGTSSLENEKLGALLSNIAKALNSGDTKALSGDLLGDLDKHLDNVVGFRSKMGAVYNRLDAAGQRNETENLNMTELLSSIQDVDIAEKTIEFTNMSAVYQASLSSGAKILQTSLLDYIR